MRTCRWEVFPQKSEIASQVGEALGCSELVAQVLLNRGILSLGDAKAFLGEMGSDFCFPEGVFDSAMDLFYRHVQAKSRVFIYGDYDVDGVSSTTMMVKFLKAFDVPLRYYVPHRFKDGYGLNFSVIDEVIRDEAGLLITLDCGISNRAEIAQLKAHSKCDVLILDHHRVPEELPAAEGIVHPKLLPEFGAEWDLAAAGVCLVFLMSVARKFELEIDSAQFLALGSLGTVADLVPLVGMNRHIVREGLAVLSQRDLVGIRGLLEATKCQKPVLNARDIGFVIGPRLNAAGRLSHAKQGVELLLSETAEEALSHSFDLEKLNQRRRDIGEIILGDALAQIEADKSVLEAPVLVLYHRDWHLGVVGIIASRLQDYYYKPVVLMGGDGDLFRGSARSIQGVDVYEILNECRDYFKSFGGHAMAAGFSLNPGTVDAFVEALRGVSFGKEVVPEPVIDVDARISGELVSLDFVEKLSRLEPFGQGNQQPVFCLENLEPLEFRLVGNGGHLKASFSDAGGRFVFDGIGFGLSDRLALLQRGRVHVVCHLGVNEWQGRQTVQLELLDVKPAN